MILTIDRSAVLANLLLAYKNGDLPKFLKLLECCQTWMDSDLFNFFSNLSRNKLFTRKGYFK